MFDPNQFLTMEVTEANSTEYVPVPVGVYTAVIEKAEVRQWQKKDDPSISGLALDVTWIIDDAGVKEALQRDKVTVRQGIMLDLTESGTLDMGKGKNVNLGKLRAATDLNEPGKPFSFNHLPGRVGKVSVKHDIVNNAPQAKVDAVAHP